MIICCILGQVRDGGEEFKPYSTTLVTILDGSGNVTTCTLTVGQIADIMRE